MLNRDSSVTDSAGRQKPQDFFESLRDGQQQTRTVYKKRPGETTNTSEKVHKSLTARLGVFIKGEKKRKERKQKTFHYKPAFHVLFLPTCLHSQDSQHSSSYILGGKKTKNKKARAELTESLAPFDGISAVLTQSQDPSALPSNCNLVSQ